MSDNAVTAEKILLKTFKDWVDWDRVFQAKASSAKIWDLVDPDQDVEPLEKPAQGRGNSRAFGPTYGKGLDQEDDDGHDLGQDKDKGKEKEDPAAGSSRSKGKKRKSEQSGPNNKKKVRSDDDQDQDAPICEACGGK
ncbi:polyprotein [Ilyonectria robusta]